MKKLVILIVIVAGATYAWINRDSLSGKTDADDYAMKGYKQSMDKARQVEQVLQKSKDQLDDSVNNSQ
ncbi:MAG: hypothetical protein R3188_00675 [Acidiferrobacterales bacterium]|nr:hypothetical protein [Acidiferrobacterales bacterium]